MLRKYNAFLLLLVPLAACSGGMSIDRGTQTFRAGVGDAAATPLEDLNVRRDAIPAVLTEAFAHPYNLEGLSGCRRISAEVSRLDEALGPDLDDPDRASVERTEDIAAGAALDVVRAVSYTHLRAHET